MKAVFVRGCVLLVAASLTGCAAMRQGASNAGGVEVTRQHLGQPIARGQIAVEAFDPADANSPEFLSYASSVARQLARLGWTVVGTAGQTEQVALIDVQQGSRAALTGGASRMSGARGTAAAGASVGAAAGPAATKLEVRIKRRSDGTVIWEGRAIGENRADSSGTQRTAAVEMLATALFQDFPGESGRTIRVP